MMYASIRTLTVSSGTKESAAFLAESKCDYPVARTRGRERQQVLYRSEAAADRDFQKAIHREIFYGMVSNNLVLTVCFPDSIDTFYIPRFNYN